MPLLRRLWSAALAAPLVLAAACAHDPPPPLVAALPAADPAPSAPCPYASANDGVQSYAILCRDPVANHVKVKHILIAWKDLALPGRTLDPRAAERTFTQAKALALELLQKVRDGVPIEALMEQYSEDPGSAHDGKAYDASPDANLVSEFKSLALRLDVGEAGIVKSEFGFHIIKRVQ